MDDDLESVHIGKSVSSLDISGPTPEKKTKKSRSTCLNVCLCATVFMFGFLIVSMSIAYMCLASFVQIYTVEYRPSLDLETVHVPEWELERFNERVGVFVDALATEGAVPPEQFKIEERELNGLVTRSDSLSGHMLAHFEENKVSLDISMPTDFLPGGRGRRFVANQSLVWRGDSTLSLVTAVHSEKTADHAFSKESPYDDPSDHAFLGEFFFHLERSNDQKLGLYFDGGRTTSNSRLMAKEEDLLAELYESDDADNQEFVRELNGIDKVSLNKGQIIVHTRDGERRRLTAMDASSYLFGGMSSIARRLVGF